MLLELYDFGIETRELHGLLGAFLGLVFGISAQISRFCLRRAVAGPREERASAGAVWLTGLATAILAFTVATRFGWVDLAGHRFLSAELPIAALVIGGLVFGGGMVLTRGCVSRLTILSATGNMRAILVLLTFAVVAHATLKGILAPVRTWIGSFTFEAPVGAISEFTLGLPLLALAVAAFALRLFQQSRPRARDLAFGALVGLVAVAGWAGTSVLFFDDFDPLPVQTVAFTLPWSDTLFWTIASTAIPASFGVGFIAGVLGGSFTSAAARGELELQSFESPRQTLRYIGGGAMMGLGGVLAGGCTIGAGLSGVAAGSIAAFVALVSIVVGGWLASEASDIRRASPAAA